MCCELVRIIKSSRVSAEYTLLMELSLVPYFQTEEHVTWSVEGHVDP